MADFAFQITDGTTTLDFNSGTEYQVKSGRNSGWRPAITTRRRSVMGNQLPWNDVEENIPITISGATVDAIISSETDLINLIDQAQRWQDGDNVDAVVFKYRTHDSTIANPLQSTILGTSGPVLTYTSDYFEISQTLTRHYILSFVRLGVWLGDEETHQETTQNPAEVITFNFTDTVDFGVVDFDFVTSGYITAGRSWRGLIIGSDRNVSDHIEIDNFEDITLTSGFSSGTTRGSLARSGVTIATADSATGEATLILANADVYNAELVDVYILARIDDTTHDGTQFDFSAQFVTDGDFPASNQENVLIPGAENGLIPVLYKLGPLSKDWPQTRIEFNYTRTGTQDLQIDYIIAVKRDSDFTNIMAVYDNIEGALAPTDYRLDHRLLTDPYPIFHAVDDADRYPVTTQGNMIFLSNSNEMSICVAVQGGSTANQTNWRYSPGTSLVSFNVTARRRPIYLVPQ